MRQVVYLAPIRDYIASLVHPSVRGDALAAARHRAFIAPRLLGGLIGLAAFPLLLAVNGAPTMVEATFFGWLGLPIVIAFFLSRTGRFDHAYMLSSLALTALVTALAAETGGIESVAAVWLVVVPIDAALSATRRVVAVASIAAVAAAGLLLGLGYAVTLPPAISGHESVVLAAIGIGSAALYAAALAVGAEALARAGDELLGLEEARYQLLAHHMTDIIARHGRNGAIRFISPAAERLLAVPTGELCGHGLFDRVHVADRPAYLTALADAAADGGSHSVEFRVRRGQLGPAAKHAAQFVWFEMRCRPLDGAAGSRDREVVSVMRDVTERKGQQQALEEAHADAERANATKSQFLTTMSHELRTPLNAIIGFSQMLVDDDQLNIGAARRRDYAQLINDSGGHLLAVVNGILDMSRIEMGHFEITPEPFALAPVIANCCDLLALKARDIGIELAVRRCDGIPELIADKRAVKQILLNLLANAIKFTESGGRVTVGAIAEGATVAVTVEDTGIGIDQADIPHLGDPFFQVRNSYDRPHEGSGLGLSIVKGLVELHGGSMTIASRRGEGTRITVRLPVDGRVTGRDDGTARIESLAVAGATGAADIRVKKRA